MMTLPPVFFIVYGATLTHGRTRVPPAGAIDTRIKTQKKTTEYEWLTERMAKNEGLWLNDKNAVIGLSN